MKRISVTFLLASFASFASLASSPFLANTPTDPTRMVKRDISGIAVFHPYVFGTKTNQTAWTVVEWYKTVYPDIENAATRLWGQAFYSMRQGLATLEGGHPVLPNLCTHAYDTPLTLVDGAWSAYILPAIGHYDMDGHVHTNEWMYGCYAVNVRTDTPLTLVVAGYEKNVNASPSNQVFNVKGVSADRSVSISAASASATVHFAIAENPMRQFFGAGMRMNGNSIIDIDPLTTFAGIGKQEYVMMVNRAKMLGNGSVSNVVTAYAADVDYTTPLKGASLERHTPSVQLLDSQHFEPESRISFCLFAGAGALSNHTVYAYGLKKWDSWLTDDQLSHIRDLDVKEMRRRGIVFPRLAPDYWTLYSWVEKTNETYTASGTGTEAVSGANYEYGTTTYDESYIAHYTVTNGIASTNMIGMGDITLSCASGTVSGDTIHFSAPGNYTVTGVDRVGNIRTNVTHISGGGGHTSTYVRYNSDTPNTWQKKANDAVWLQTSNATPQGTQSYEAWGVMTNYTRRCCRRIPCMPVSASISGQGHRGGVHPLSAHVMASARHYRWVVGCTQKYVTPGLSVTGIVTTASREYDRLDGAWIGLAEWAATNGFSAAEISAADIDDIIVSRVTSGEVPIGCRPYFATTNTIAAHFNRAGVMGWQTYQYDLGWGIPCLLEPSTMMTTAKGASSFPWDSSATGTTADLNALMRNDVRTAALPTAWNFIQITGGDSGLPTYIEIDGAFVLVNHLKAVWRGVNERFVGPSYVKGYAIIKAYVESQGDTLLTLE